jgi:hypothetical protein
MHYKAPLALCARMVELVDALASGASDRKVVEVRVLFRAPIIGLISFGNVRENLEKHRK